MSQGIFAKIRKIVSRVPEGKVTTYGTVALLAGTRDSRLVGWALRNNQDPLVPCHRVIKKNGYLAENYSLNGWREQKRRLEKEGIKFTSAMQVDFSRFEWEIKS